MLMMIREESQMRANIQSRLKRNIPPEQRATLISVNSMSFSIAMIVMFPIAGVLADHWGLTEVLVGTGMMILIFAIAAELSSKISRSRRKS